MQLIKSINKVKKYINRQKKLGKTIGFVPTMGYLHDGHLSLVRAAKKENDLCVMSIYVNPLQFGPREDFKKYPRNLKADIKLAISAHVDLIFCPTDKEMYEQDFTTLIEVGALGNLLCGLSRPGHFKGVATVVGKFFNIIQPDVAYFGQKDAQQAAVIRKFTRDLNYPVKIKVMPIVRESDGLAMSSRNTYLSLEERSDAVIIYKALQKAKKLIELGNHNPTIIKRFIVDTIKEKGKIDYVEIVNQDTLERVKKIKGKILIAVAVSIGKVRLIDNLVIKA